MRWALANLVARLAITLLMGLELATAQTANVPRVGVLANTIPTADLIAGTSTHPAITSLVKGLRDLGWVDGKNLRMVWRSAEGDMKRLPALADELARERVDVIVAYGQGGDAAMRATDHVPIVLATSGVGGRLLIDGRVRIESLARPGRNVTGLTLVSEPLGGKMLALLKEAAPRSRRVAVLSDATIAFGSKTRAAAQTLGLALESYTFDASDRLGGAFDAMTRAGIDAVIVDELPITNLLPTQRRIHELAQRHRMPVMHRVLSAVDSGGLMGYGPDINHLYRRAPYFIDRILRGTKPGDLPIEQPTELELRVNLKAARAIGLELPPSLLLQASRVIQ